MAWLCLGVDVYALSWLGITWHIMLWLVVSVDGLVVVSSDAVLGVAGWLRVRWFGCC